MNELRELYDDFQTTRMEMLNLQDQTKVAEGRIVEELIRQNRADCFHVNWGRVRRVMEMEETKTR